MEENQIEKWNEVNEQVAEVLARTAQGFRKAAENLKKAYEEHKDEIIAAVEKERLEKERLQASMPKIRVGDIVRIKSIHMAELKCYEVDRVEFDGVVSQPAGFHHDYDEIIAVYRYDGKDFKCIWEREDYKQSK